MASTTSATTPVPPDSGDDAPASSVPDSTKQTQTLYPPGSTRFVPSLPPTRDVWCTEGESPLESLLQVDGRLQDKKQDETMTSKLVDPIVMCVTSTDHIFEKLTLAVHSPTHMRNVVRIAGQESFQILPSHRIRNFDHSQCVHIQGYPCEVSSGTRIEDQ